MPFRYRAAFELLLFTGIGSLLSGCGPGPVEPAGTPVAPTTLFSLLSPERSGITFNNRISESPDLNYYTYIYAYNGGGVAVGDIDNDGLPDLYFTGNQERDRLYRNLGGLRFEDITERALGADPGGWRTGVSMVDLDGDGWLDIHVCRGGPTRDTALTRNLFYRNLGNGTFAEEAHRFGIADTGHATQAAFFDMDRDGDLDLYVINHPATRVRGLRTSQVREAIRTGNAPSNRLYRNQGGRFSDVTMAAGLVDYSFSLGISVADLDQDGMPDLYVANDFDIADAFFRAQGDGTYREVIRERTRHISNFGMGSDVADYNNDGLPDIVVLDMMADDHVRNKTNMGSMSPMAFWAIVASGNHHQYMVNTLQLNNGNGTFSEVAQLAGVARTDWSWAPLLADLDNDGWKDLLVTNGYKHDIRNNDYQQEVYSKLRSGEDFYRTLDLIPSTRIHNYLFQNDGADTNGLARLTFTDRSTAWGFQMPLNSNGAAYADLDGDGDLDLVLNNIDDVASVFENHATAINGHRHLRIALRNGPRSAIGAKAFLRHQGTVQYQELSPVRGFQSCVEDVLHFGLGTIDRVDSVEIRWPDGRYSLLRDVKAGQTMTLRQEEAGPAPAQAPLPPTWLKEQPGVLPSTYTHRENDHDDHALEVLLPHKMSEMGPRLTVGDANGDGLDDLFIGGSHGSPSTLFIQQAQGSFTKVPGPWEAHAAQEQLGALFFDADGDGDQDLIVTAGSNERDIRDALFTQRFYRNEGSGRFITVNDALPPMTTSAMRAAGADIDGDGDIDLFIGGHQTPAHYPFAPRSYLLINDGGGRFQDVTQQRAPDLMGPGMVTDARFADLDGDGAPDLVLCGEWMPVMVLRNTGGRFENWSEQAGTSGTEGWWNTLAVADLDGDGDLDLVGGNLGWNSKFKADAEHPLHIYWADMDGNGRSDIVLAKEKGGKQLPVRGRECSSQQCPVIMQRFPTYEAFANADLSAIYTPEKLADALHLKAVQMRSSVFLNDGQARFTRRDLPILAQTAPVNGIIPLDVDGDGILDLVVAGNRWGAEVETVRYDAGTGLVLKGDGHGSFRPVPIDRSGFFAWGHVTDVALVHLGARRVPAIVVGNNNDVPQVFLPGGTISALSAR